MSSRPSVGGLDAVSAAFDLNTEAAPTVTQGNSVEGTAAEATADGAGNHKDAGGEEETKVAVDHEVVPAGVNSCNGIGRLDTAVSGQGHDILPSDGEYDRDGVSTTLGVDALEDKTRCQISDRVVVTVGAVGVEHGSDGPAISSARADQKLSLSIGASGCDDSEREHTFRSMDVDVIISEEASATGTSGKSLGDQRQEHDNVVDDVADDVADDKTESLAARKVQRPSVKCMATGNDLETSQFVCYQLPYNDRSEFRVSDMIWGKVKSHPWWPGQIVDPSFASKLALKHQRKKDSHLVAYFGDKTFAWCDDSQLKPFSTFFSQMEKQSSNEGFRDAVNSSLCEVFRRVQMGMVCSCVPERSYSELKVHKFDSSGVRKGVAAASVDKSECLQMFKPDIFLKYITTLARFPTCHTSWFDITVAHAQLMAYIRLGGHFSCSVASTGKLPLGSKGESSPCKNSVALSTPISDFDDTLLCNLTSMKTRSRSGINSQKKHKLLQEDARKEESSSQHVGFKRENNLKDGVGFRKRTKRLGISPIDSGNRKAKKRMLELSESIEVKSPSSAPHKSFIIGECISRIASKLTSLPHNLKSIGDTKKKDKVDPEYDGPFSIDSSIPLSEPQHLMDKRFPDEDMSMCKLFSQFALIASDPLTIHDFCPIIVSFFSDVRLLQCSASNVPIEFWRETCDSGSAEGMEPPKEMKRRRGRPKLVSSKDNNSFPEEGLKAHSEIKRKRGRPPHSEIKRKRGRPPHSEIKRKRGRPPKSSYIENNKNSLEEIEQFQMEKRKRRRPAKYSNGEDIKLHRENEGKKVRPTDGKEPCEEDDSKKTQVELVPVRDNSEMLMPDYLNDSYWTDVVVQNSPKKRRRGRKRQEESLVNRTCSTLRPDSEPPVSRSSTSISDTQTHQISSVSHNNGNGLVCERRITYFGEKCAEEFNPTALVLNFSATCSLPSEMDLVRIFSRYGPLRESDTELQKHTRRSIVVFKRRADAELAFKEVPFSRFGPALVDFCLKNFPLQSDNTREIIAEGAKDGGNFEYSGNKNELFHGGSLPLEVTNARLGETSRNRSMVDNLKQSLPSPMYICKPEILPAEKGDFPSQKSTVLPTWTEGTVSDSSHFQAMFSGGQTLMDVFLGNVQDPKRDGDRSHAILELNANEISVDDDSFAISCDPEKLPYQSSSVIANTSQVESAGVDHVEIVVEEPSMKVDVAQVPGRRGDSMQCDETGCSLRHSLSVETAMKVCSSKQVMLSGGLHEMNDASVNIQRPGCDLRSESLVDNKNEIPLDTCVTVSVKDSTSAVISQIGNQDVKPEESHAIGSSLYDLGNTNLFSVDVCNFEGIEREKNRALDDSTVSDGKPHDAADCMFQALGSAEEPAVELIRAEVQGQQCRVLGVDGDMEVPAVRRVETNLHVTGKGSADIKDLHHSLDCNELVSDGGKEQAAQNSRSPYTPGTTKESSVSDSRSDITDLRLQDELASFTGRKVD